MRARRPDPREARQGSAPPVGVWGGMAVAAVVLVLAAVVLGDRPSLDLDAAGSGALVQARDTLGQEDLRCLTRRAEDCLEHPVPADEPHNAMCSTCHDLWEGDASSVRGCADADCHDEPRDLSSFHQTVRPTLLEDCTACHRPHDFRAPRDGAGCQVCHAGGGVRFPGDPDDGRGLTGLPVAFEHPSHATVSCATCHENGAGHTGVRLDDLQDCRSCHHESSESASCLACHELTEVLSIAFTVERPLDIHVGTLDGPVRALPFQHRIHWDNGCSSCHVDGVDRGTEGGADCSSCHYEHHDPTADCSVCHDAPTPGAHDRQVHLTCQGAGCHQAVPPGLVPVPRSRELCLACHGDLVDHEPGQDCAHCHVLPEPR